jgi:regulator of sirC expression with transglutaminase-like and TPR domain
VDALDELADEVTVCEAAHDEEALCEYLFGSGRFRANTEDYYGPENSDLLWILQNRRGNPIGLTVLAMLLARRLGLSIHGCSFPGHFLGWIGHGEDSILVDCYHRGRLISMKEMQSKPAQLSEEARLALQQSCTLHDILQRMLVNLQFALAQSSRNDDAALVSDLLESIVTAP